ncbi:MAG TPA: hypothetical protein VGC58_00295, partial [Candidatus Paceibacterota bacterium]
MTGLSKKEAVILFCGDVFFFVLSLWISLYFRFGEVPNSERFFAHFTPFSILFIVWILVYFIAGLYEKHTLILKSKLPSVIFNAQVVNSIFAIVFFYAIPVFGITPKTILFIYLFVSFIAILLWRLYGEIVLGSTEKQPALLIGAGEEMKELLKEVNGNTRYDIFFTSSFDVHNLSAIDIKQEIVTPVYSDNIK